MSRVVDVCFARFMSIEEPFRDDPHLEEGQDIELAPGLKASCLTEELRERIDKACQPANYNVGDGSGVGLTYGFIREGRTGGHWDADGVLARVLALSRVIHPSQHGADYCASLYFADTGTLECIFGDSSPVAAYNCRASRPWLTPNDLVELGALFRAYESLPIVPEPPPEGLKPWQESPPSFRRLPRRLHRAMWNFAYAAYVKPSHIRWLVVATAAEGIIETGKQARQEFITRLPAISDEVGAPMTRKQADAIYGLRSSVAHAGWFVGKTDEELDASYMPLDRFVAGVIRKAIYDGEFRAHFEDRDTVTRKWPVEPPAEVT
jgi:hypothetical protein